MRQFLRLVILNSQHLGMSAAVGEITRHVLAKESEFRAEVDPSGTVCVKLVSGNAEIFGVELAEGRTYTFYAGRKFAVYTWYVYGYALATFNWRNKVPHL